VHELALVGNLARVVVVSVNVLALENHLADDVIEYKWPYVKRLRRRTGMR
jgi:hypothetical protein